jgi:hypothetical protein
VARRFHHRGYVIKCYAEPVAASGQWRLRIAIWTKTNGLIELHQFVGPTVHAGEDEVEILSIAYAQRIIDEMVLGLKAS